MGSIFKLSTDTLSFLSQSATFTSFDNEGQTLPKVVPFVIVYRISKNKKNANFFTLLIAHMDVLLWAGEGYLGGRKKFRESLLNR